MREPGPPPTPEPGLAPSPLFRKNLEREKTEFRNPAKAGFHTASLPDGRGRENGAATPSVRDWP
ncbi:hypothetical protein PCLA_19r0027 [Pseudomonas citronellolis]|nr:hypothetical protein PCLA_19r0027 [Pseudomonas citronellolis]